jgi:hypothetical protein
MLQECCSQARSHQLSTLWAGVAALRNPASKHVLLLLRAGAVCSHSHWLFGVGPQDHTQLHGPIQGAAPRGGQHGAVTSAVLQLPDCACKVGSCRCRVNEAAGTYSRIVTGCEHRAAACCSHALSTAGCRAARVEFSRSMLSCMGPYREQHRKVGAATLWLFSVAIDACALS